MCGGHRSIGMQHHISRLRPCLATSELSVLTSKVDKLADEEKGVDLVSFFCPRETPSAP